MAKILVVEDDPSNAEIVRRLLQRHGHDPLFAANGEDAFNSADEQLPDLILMDIMIPVKAEEDPRCETGLEVTRRLKSRERTRGIPIIALTARNMPDERAVIRQAGCDDVITKPFQFSDFLSTLDLYLPAPA